MKPEPSLINLADRLDLLAERILADGLAAGYTHTDRLDLWLCEAVENADADIAAEVIRG